tara:strand:- start:1031 stop:1630 length:600 start_codon:yes stop_codon:yes gene_type:complete
MTFHNKVGRFAGGFADLLTANKFDFDGLGRGFKKAEDTDLLEREDPEDSKEMGLLDRFLAGLQSYNPEKNKTESDKFLDKMSAQGFKPGGGGSFANLGDGLSMFNPDNSAREAAILQQNELNARAAAQKKESTTRFAGGVGTAIGTAIGGPVGGLIGGALGGLFCDIRLKEDIAPLQKSEVNDVLSECAFFVKDLNELS